MKYNVCVPFLYFYCIDVTVVFSSFYKSSLYKKKHKGAAIFKICLPSPNSLMKKYHTPIFPFKIIIQLFSTYSICLQINLLLLFHQYNFKI